MWVPIKATMPHCSGTKDIICSQCMANTDRTEKWYNAQIYKISKNHHKDSQSTMSSGHPYHWSFAHHIKGHSCHNVQSLSTLSCTEAQQSHNPLFQIHQLIWGLPQPHTSLFMQLQTGHTPLNHHLHWIGCVRSPICPAVRKPMKWYYITLSHTSW